LELGNWEILKFPVLRRHVCSIILAEQTRFPNFPIPKFQNLEIKVDMRLIKLALISAVILFLMVWLFSLLMPSRIRVSRAIDISVPKDSVVSAIADLQQWQHWNDLVNNDQYTNKQYTASKFIADQISITAHPVKGDTLLTTWKQKSGRTITGGFTWDGNNRRMVLQWYFDIHLRWYPWEKFSSIIFDKQLGPPMEKSLANLKNLLEKKP
jgi:hypothetical protein